MRMHEFRVSRINSWISFYRILIPDIEVRFSGSVTLVKEFFSRIHSYTGFLESLNLVIT